MVKNKTNILTQFYYKIRRTIKKIKLSSNIDKHNGPKINLDKLDKTSVDALKIIKKVAADDTTIIYVSNRKKETILFNETYRILIQHNNIKISNVYIQKEFVYVVNLDDETLLYAEWLIQRRIEVNFNKQYTIIKTAYEKQINELLEDEQ